MERHSGRVLVLDDAPLRRKLVCSTLAGRGHVVRGESAKSASNTVVDVFEPDAVVVELNGENPADIVSALRRSRSRRVVFVASRNSTKAARIAALYAGADGVLVDPFDVDELVAYLETMMSWGYHHSDVHSDVLGVHDVTIDPGAHMVTRNGVELSLTLTEFKLLEVLVRNAGMVMSKRNLLEQVWGYGEYDPNVVEVHVSALRKKLESAGNPVIETVRGVGYVIRKTAGTGHQREDRSTRNDRNAGI